MNTEHEVSPAVSPATRAASTDATGVAASAANPAAAPRPGRYRIDASGSRITFRTRHLLGLGLVTGTFAIRSGTVEVGDPISAAAVEVHVDVASFRSGNRQRDGAVRSRRFLDAARFPVIEFRGDQVSAAGDSVSGTLTVRDVSRPVTLSVGHVSASGQSFTAQASLRVDRAEFGVTASRGLAGRHLELTAEVRCIRA